MKKAINLISLIILLIVALSFVTTNFTYANEEINVNTYNPSKYKNEYFTPEDQNVVKGITENTAGYLAGAAVIISLIALIVIGIKYILGSTTEKVEYKKNLLPVVVGILIIVGISSIVGILSQVGGSLNSLGSFMSRFGY